jgi:hypothetical protein
VGFHANLTVTKEKIMNSRFCILVATLLSTVCTYGLLRPGTVWYTATDVNHPELVERMMQIETLAKSRKYREAADALGLLLTTTNADARAELDQPNAHDGPLDLQLTIERCRYLDLCKDSGQAAELCRNLTARYADAAAGTRWESYARAFLYRAHAVPGWWKSPAALALIEQALDYYPTYSWAMGDYLLVSYNLRDSHGLTAARNRFAAYEAAGGARNAKIDRSYLKILLAGGADPYTQALAYLDENPDADSKYLLEAIDIARAGIDPDQPSQFHEFYDALTTLALRQPGDEQHILVVGHILNEKDKLEMIMPELKN